MNEIYDLVIKQTNITPEQCAVLLPSKVSTLVNNRIGWVRTYLYKAGLLTQVSRGYYHISPDGINAIKDNPNGIDIRYLRKLPAFQEWGASFSGNKLDQSDVSNGIDTMKTPQELLESSYQEIISSVTDELLDRIKKASPAFFEKLVVDVLIAMGYGGFDSSNGQVTQYSGMEA